MKKIFYLISFLTFWIGAGAQSISPGIKAGFGVEGELRANFFNNFAQSGNDDWFNMGTPGAGAFVIDTTGAAALLAAYAVNPNYRQLPFYRTMKYPAYSVVNNKLLLDAIFIRDYHGEDSTIFAAGASKNGDSPANWSCPVAQSVPDKNEILDMMVHVRRAGPNNIKSDSLWLFGGLSIENTNGDRYFDFEMYQTDIYYDRPTQKFYGYGPNAGHTAWTFDALGNITKPGDIIFSADFGSSTLTSLEARIWVDQASLLLTPVDFKWSGSFNGASNGSQYGYAGILPKTAGNFYLGVESPANTWAGPFSLVRGDNSVVTTYTAGQFMEIGVNLTKLGLDPVSLLGANACGMPFRRILVKSRASTSFTAALKDFVGPFDFFLPARAAIKPDQSVLCGFIGASTIVVTNPVSTSIYTWSTTNGHIVSTSSNGTSITVDSPGTYVIKQQLQSGCATYATDTAVIFFNSSCYVLENKLLAFNGNPSDGKVQLNWMVDAYNYINYFHVERSMDGTKFAPVSQIFATQDNSQVSRYSAVDVPSDFISNRVYYRLKITGKSGNVTYSKTLNLSVAQKEKVMVRITPNPIRNTMQLNLISLMHNTVQISIYDVWGKLMRTEHQQVSKGTNSLTLTGFESWPGGFYTVKVLMGENVYKNKVLFIK